MSLTGHIDVFPLEEVLRLLARSYKSGCLRVDAPDLHGRVFMNGGSVTFATVGSDEDLRRAGHWREEVGGEEHQERPEVDKQAASGGRLASGFSSGWIDCLAHSGGSPELARATARGSNGRRSPAC